MWERSAYVHRLLELLDDWPGAPRFLGVDSEQREILSFIPGHVAWEDEQPPSVGSDESLMIVAGLVREFHDRVSGSELAEDEEVVCHNDLAPRNTVYREENGVLRPVAFIDWDIAAPGRRVHDVAHVCWQFVRLGPEHPDAGDAARRTRLVCDAYGLDERRDVVETILWWQDRCWRGIEAKASAGDEAMARLARRGAVTEVKASFGWVNKHRAIFEDALL